jgi:hypothetical protein
VGGVFLQTLYDRDLWQKWAGRDHTKASGYAPMPIPPVVKVVVRAADEEPATWRYTFEEPGQGWEQPEFDDSTWEEGHSGFGTRGTPGAIVGQRWRTPDIWIRREFEFPAGEYSDLRLYLNHDEDAEVYINGVLAARVEGYNGTYEAIPMTEDARRALRPGATNTFAVHCRQTTGGQFIDVGLATVEPGRASTEE